MQAWRAAGAKSQSLLALAITFQGGSLQRLFASETNLHIFGNNFLPKLDKRESNYVHGPTATQF